jgi:hypothetical protein
MLRQTLGESLLEVVNHLKKVAHGRRQICARPARLKSRAVCRNLLDATLQRVHYWCSMTRQ